MPTIQHLTDRDAIAALRKRVLAEVYSMRRGDALEYHQLKARMSEHDDSAIELERTIVDAFVQKPLPPRKVLVYRGSWETGDLLRNLTKVRDTPTDQFIEWHADSLPVFTPEGLRHVLPYYMRYSLRHPRSEAAERLIFHLAPAEADDDYWRPRLAVFSQAERNAICAFLGFLEKELAGESYESHFARARAVWGCSQPVEIMRRGGMLPTD